MVLVTVTLTITAKALEGTPPPVVDPEGMVPATWMVREELEPKVFDSHWVRSTPERFEGLLALVSQIR